MIVIVLVHVWFLVISGLIPILGSLQFNLLLTSVNNICLRLLCYLRLENVDVFNKFIKIFKDLILNLNMLQVLHPFGRKELFVHGGPKEPANSKKKGCDSSDVNEEVKDVEEEEMNKEDE